MAEPLPLEEFAEKTGVSPDEVERYRAAGFLDFDTDELFDDLDIMRLHALLQYADQGLPLEEFAEFVTKSDDPNLPLLFARERKTYPLEEAIERSGVPLEQMISMGTLLGL